MKDYDERDKKTAGRPPLWQSSDGRLRETAPAPYQEGKPHQTGYCAGENEGRGRPRETGRMSGSFGDVSVGFSRKKELTLVASRSRAREGPATTGEEKQLRADSAKRMNLARGNFQINSRDEKKSAVAYRESHKKQPAWMLERFREMMQQREQRTLEEQMPFLDREPEKKALHRLCEEEAFLRTQEGAGNRSALQRVESRKQQQRQAITEKEGQERRLRLLLQKAQEESRRQAGEWSWDPLVSIELLEMEEPPPEDGEAPPPNNPKAAGAAGIAALEMEKTEPEKGESDLQT